MAIVISVILDFISWYLLKKLYKITQPTFYTLHDLNINQIMIEISLVTFYSLTVFAFHACM